MAYMGQYRYRYHYHSHDKGWVPITSALVPRTCKHIPALVRHKRDIVESQYRI